jgi:uncharacterized protein
MIGNYTMLYQIRVTCFIVGMVALMFTDTTAQQVTKVEEDIAVIARPSTDSITLRWAPVTIDHWRTANQYGYSIERFTLVRNGKVIRPAERKLLTAAPLKPLPEEQWEKFIGNKYGMITAQALYGETFELDIAHTDIMQIVNKAQENEQRYSIALFCADMSPVIAKAQGLYFTDKQIEKNVKYLYRIRVVTPTDTLRGSVFIDPQQKYQLPAVAEVSGQATGSAITLRWKLSDYSSLYTTYSVERSEDGKLFSPVTDVPGVTLSKKGQDSKYQYAVDTLAETGKEYSYRVRGITPFGEYGPASNIVKVKGNKTIISSVFITSALSTDNKSIDIQWEFPEAENEALAGFEVTRSATSSGPYKTITKSILAPSARYFKDTTPQQSNYYKLKAKTLDGTEVISMPYLAMLVDSIPPAIPTGLKGKVDDYGNVSINWKPNRDADIYGYRIYRAYYQSEEFALMTGEPLKDTVFTDRVQLQSLNERIHYQVMAIDKNQNHSGLSAILSLALPDKVPPMPPVWRPVKSTDNGVVLTWEPSGSQDVVKYEVYRKGDQGQWIRLTTKIASTDSVYTYTDQNLPNSNVQHYTVIAIDEASLESPPAPVVTGFMLPKPKPGVTMSEPKVDYDKRTIVLNWTYDQPSVASFRIYRKINDGTIQLYRTVKDKQFVDIGMVVDTKYTYTVMAVFGNGALSEMSKHIVITY